PPSSIEALKTLGKIENILKSNLGENKYYIAGMTQIANDLFQSTLSELLLYCAIAGAIVVIILLLTTSSLTEPLVLAMTIVVSIILNLGTNIIFPSTSIVTFACSAILQLGLSMDYSIFLMHSFKDKLKFTLDPKEALRQALPETTKAVAASALTTIGGFLALLVMKFSIGFDLGLSLAKGIIMSFLCVIFMQPALILMTEKGRKRTVHRCLDIKFRPVVKRAIKWKPILISILLIAIVPIFYVQQFTLQYKYIKFMDTQGDGSNKEIMADTLANQVIIALPIEGNVESIEKHYQFVNELNKLEETDDISFTLGLCSLVPYNTDVTADIGFGETKLKSQVAIATMVGIIQTRQQNSSTEASSSALSDLDTYINMGEMLISGGYTIYTVGLNRNIDVESQRSFDILHKIQSVAEDIFSDRDENGNKYVYQENGEKYVYMTGITQAAADFAEITPDDFLLVTIISVAVIFVIILLHLKSLKLATLLIALIEFGIWLNLAMQHIFSGGTINFMSYLIIGAVQLGSTVDYAILVASKYKELRKRFKAPQAAYIATTSSTMSILTSAGIMSGACLSVFFVSSNLIVKEMTFLIARSSIIAALLVIFFLPALLSFFDKNKGGEINFFLTPNLRKITKRNIQILSASDKKKEKKEQVLSQMEVDAMIEGKVEEVKDAQ
ncbi:MAG: MMPL family transporter, partial [Lachnospiraceae bacterium]|nr:MMPL family transporter [Lachnospiraceae bacterium]